MKSRLLVFFLGFILSSTAWSMSLLPRPIHPEIAEKCEKELSKTYLNVRELYIADGQCSRKIMRPFNPIGNCGALIPYPPNHLSCFSATQSNLQPGTEVINLEFIENQFDHGAQQDIETLLQLTEALMQNYRFFSLDTELVNELSMLRNTFLQFAPKKDHEKLKKIIGLKSIQFSDEASSQNNNEEARFYLALAKEAADFVLGALPITSLAKDSYELLTGKKLLTGENLSNMDRALSLLNILSLGSSASLKSTFGIAERCVIKLGSILPRNSSDALREAVGKSFQYFHGTEEILKGWRRNHQIIDVKKAEEINQEFLAMGWRAPYQEHTKIVQFKTKSEGKWVRVHGEGNRAEGSWLMKEEAIHGLSPEQIKSKYSLPQLPTHVTDVFVGKGITMNRGKVAGNFEGGEGAIQYHLQERLPSSAYQNTRPLRENHELRNN